MELAAIEPSVNRVIAVAVPVPLRQTFDFLVPYEQRVGEPGTPQIGARVKVPFGSRVLVGIITDVKNSSDYPIEKLKPALELLDTQSVFDKPLWETLLWLSRYYVAPLGEVLELALPVLLRQAADAQPVAKKTWRLTEHGRSSSVDELNRAPLQLAIVKRFMRRSLLNSADFKESSSGWRQAVAALLEKGWIEEFESLPQLQVSAAKQASSIVLSEQQQNAADSIAALIDQAKFAPCLLHGVTGSGKTEVYFAAIEKVLQADADQQVLFLVPEIGLTPQLIDRVSQRFAVGVVVMHSGLSDSERHLAWWHAKTGGARIVIGTRSAVFSEFAKLALIVIDEEHDASFKQQDSVRYQARDVAIYRAKQHDIPILLGSATPSLETYLNAQQGRYQLMTLQQRATQAALPEIHLLDLNRQPSSDGLSPSMLELIGQTLQRNKQVMLFLNRRGYAPVIYCESCRETAKCQRCDSNLTLHQRINRVRCHHCGYEARAISQCRSCQSEKLVEVGEGTQRVEDALATRFPEAKLLRIDRDSTRRKGELQDLLEQARDGKADILLGTQLITKGHDFPEVAMVGILEADQGLHSTDFRASEALFQQIIQVAGRAGRRDDLGHVYIQTRFPDDPFFEHVVKHDFDAFAEQLLSQRKIVNYPPYGFFALLRAESTHQAKALQFLRRARLDMRPAPGVQLMDAIPAPMERRAGRYRAQLLITAEQRSALNATLTNWLDFLSSSAETKKLSSSVRWSVDIDPIDHY